MTSNIKQTASSFYSKTANNAANNITGSVSFIASNNNTKNNESFSYRGTSLLKHDNTTRTAVGPSAIFESGKNRLMSWNVTLFWVLTSEDPTRMLCRARCDKGKKR